MSRHAKTVELIEMRDLVCLCARCHSLYHEGTQQTKEPTAI